MDRHHVREIEAVGEGHPPLRDGIVVASWLRCLNQHGLDPTRRSEAYILPETQLRAHRQQSEDLIAIARSGIENLYATVAGQNYVLMLADRAGVTVEYLGDEAQKAALRKSGLYLGAEWSEARAGTCALGACIESGEALVIHQSDHFDETHSALSCTAAPIYDTKGILTAVLDISLLSSPIQKASQSMALNLVGAAARRVEMANIMAESRREWVLRLAGSPDFLDVDPEAAVSLDSAGRVIGMTHGAARIMARAVGADWRKAGLIGRPLSDFLNLRLDRLDDLTRQRPAAERYIETRDGHRLFAHAIEPRRVPIRSVGPMPPAFRDLHGGDPAMAAVLSRAAMLAPQTLPLLIEGETGSGKQTLARAIHSAGRGGPLVVVDCADLDGHEAVLFGTKTRDGLIAAAYGGTLLLDKVNEMPLPLQARILRLAAEGVWLPPSATRAINANLRILSTSQTDLSAEVDAGRFRRDLFHRLGGTTLRLPPLRDRQDLLWLVERMLHRAGAAHLELPPATLSMLAAHGWPGNLRELANLAASLSGLAGDSVQSADLPDAIRAAPVRQVGLTRAVVAKVLAETGGNVSATARRLGVNRSTIHRQINRHALGPHA